MIDYLDDKMLRIYCEHIVREINEMVKNCDYEINEAADKQSRNVAFHIGKMNGLISVRDKLDSLLNKRKGIL
jgi:hypothetical protein